MNSQIKNLCLCCVSNLFLVVQSGDIYCTVLVMFSGACLRSVIPGVIYPMKAVIMHFCIEVGLHMIIFIICEICGHCHNSHWWQACASLGEWLIEPNTAIITSSSDKQMCSLIEIHRAKL